MSNNQNYGLLNNLFSTPVQPPKSARSDENTKKSPTTQRTWKIKDELWEDFTVLVAMSGMTQAEYINKLIGADIEQNSLRIEKYRDIMKT